MPHHITRQIYRSSLHRQYHVLAILEGIIQKILWAPRTNSTLVRKNEDQIHQPINATAINLKLKKAHWALETSAEGGFCRSDCRVPQPSKSLEFFSYLLPSVQLALAAPNTCDYRITNFSLNLWPPARQ